MTQLQVEYNKLREQQRANLAQEEIRSREATVKEIEAQQHQVETELKALKAPSEIQLAVSQANMNDAHSQVFISQLSEIAAKIEETKASTNLKREQGRLTHAEVEREQVALTNDIMSLIHRTTGITFPGDAEDQIFGWIGNILGGAGKAIGGKLIG